MALAKFGARMAPPGEFKPCHAARDGPRSCFAALGKTVTQILSVPFLSGGGKESGVGAAGPDGELGLSSAMRTSALVGGSVVVPIDPGVYAAAFEANSDPRSRGRACEFLPADGDVEASVELGVFRFARLH